MAVVKLLSVALMNEPGAFAHVAATLGGAGINIEAWVGDTHAEIGVARILVSDAEKAAEILKLAGHPVQVVEGVVLELANKPGELSRALQALGRAGVNIEFAFGATGAGSRGEAIFVVDDPATAKRVLHGR